MPPRHNRRIALIGAAVLLLAALSGSSSAAPGIPLPEHDSFYSYTGRTPLSKLPPGTPLKQRTVTLGATTNATPLTAEQVLYRTTDRTGRAVATVTTFVLPVTGTVAPKVVAYLSFYDAFVSRCNPSYTLRGGDSGSANSGQAQAEQGVVQALHNSGYIVTVPDFENQSMHFLSGIEAGMSTLDGIKATLAVLGLGRSTPVGMMGYSGGSIAADWASEVAGRYAPDLNLVGVAAGGMPVHFGNILTYVDGHAKWSSMTSATLLGMARAYHFDLTPYLTDYGSKVVKAVSRQCIAEFPGSVTLKQLLKPQFVDLARIPAFKRALNELIMGSAPGHPTAPMLIVAGNLDGTGDGVMIAADQRALATQYCQQGVAVEYKELKQGEHTQVGFAFMPLAFAFLAERFTDAPPVTSCSIIGQRSSLAPLSEGVLR